MLARWLALLPAAAAAALAQTAPQPASVSGTVINSITGEPIVRAHVMVHCSSENPQQGQQIYGALTNEKGAYSITPFPAGNCWVDAERVGFLAPRSGTTALASGSHTEGLKLTLTPTGAITGRVVNAAGEPAEGVNVTAEMGSGNSTNATTDDKGQFRIGGLRPGTYRVKAAKESLPFPPEIRADGSIELREATTYYPDSLIAKTAQRLDVKAGADVSGVEIKLVQTPIVQVSGKVTGIPPGTKDVMVNIWPSGQGTSTKADGTFSLWRLDPGKYTVRAQHWAGQLQLQSAPLEIELTTANVEHVELPLVPPFEIAGQLRFDDDQAREPVKLPVRQDGTAAPAPPAVLRTVQLRASGPQGPQASAVLSADDRFLLEKLQPGRYSVAVTGVSGYVKSVRAGQTETEGDTLDLTNGAPNPVTLTLSSNFCEISGTVRDAKGPVAGAPIVLASTGDRSNFHMGNSRSDGTYQFRVPPGKYQVAALDEFSVGWGFQGPDLSDYEAESLDLSAGDKITRDLTQRK